MKKLLILSDISASYRVEVFKGLASRFDVSLFFNRTKDPERNPAWSRRPENGFGFDVLDNKTSIEKYKRTLRGIKEFDLVICYDPWTARARALERLCIRKRIPFVLNADGAFHINRSFPKKQIKTYYAKRAALCLAGCERAAEYFRTYGVDDNRIAKHPFTSIYKSQMLDSPISAEEKSELKRRLGFERDVAFLTVGQFIQRKGFDLLLDAWAMTSESAELFIIGGGRLEDEYRDTVNRKGLKNVRILGFKPEAELSEYYLASDVFLMPTREDIWGLVVNEAMSRALPVVSSDRCTAGNELIKNGINGYVYPCEDVASLAKYIDILTRDAELRRQLSENALSAIAEHSYENVIESHTESIERLLGAGEV